MVPKINYTDIMRRSLVSPHYGIPTSDYYRPALSLSPRFYSSSLVALIFGDPSSNDPRISQFQLNDRFKETPRRVDGFNWPDSKSLSCVVENDLRKAKFENRRVTDFDTEVIYPELRRECTLRWYSELLRECTLSRFLNEVKAIHGQVIKSGIDLDSHLWVSLINSYATCGCLNLARLVFDEMPERDVVAWTALFSGFVAEGRCSEGLGLVCDMHRQGIEPNEFTFATVLKACSMCLNVEFGKQLHGQIVKNGVFPKAYVGSALVDLYAKFGEVEYAENVLFFMPEQNSVSWNALLNGYAQVGDGDGVLRLFSQMKETANKFNSFTLSTVLKGCVNSENLSAGCIVHGMAIKNGCESDEFVSCSLVNMYSKCRQPDDALKVFLRIPTPEIVTWNALISCLNQQGRKQKAADQVEKVTLYFNLIRQEGVKPNQFTLASCLSVCSGIGSLENGRQLHSLAIKDGHFVDTIVSGALIDMYGKCGSIDDAEIIFKALDSHNTVLWSTIICQYSQHGKEKEALVAFDNMLDEGVSPNGITFIGILSACSYMGLVEVGRNYFHSMEEVYGITPSIKHYACMVDILGRAGKFDEVESFIKKMKLTPNGLIWQTVLGTCKDHGNVELGERVAEKLFEMEPERSSNYMLLSNLYAAQGMWDDSLRIRALMPSRGVKKERGCSWVEVDAETHVFLS